MTSVRIAPQEITFGGRGKSWPSFADHYHTALPASDAAVVTPTGASPQQKRYGRANRLARLCPSHHF